VAAITVAKRHIKLLVMKRKKMKLPQPGDAVTVQEVLGNVQVVNRAALRVWGVKRTNDTVGSKFRKVSAWVIVERPRSMRQRDNRLGRFIACPLEACC